MRQVLFRGKDNLGIWHYGNLHSDTVTGSDKYYINLRISTDNPNFIEVNELSVGQITDSIDVNGDNIWEGHRVNQKSALIGDENVDFTGLVRFLEGCWVIDNGKDVIPLWSEHRENKII